MRPVRLALTAFFFVLPVAVWPGSSSFDTLKFLVAGLTAGIVLVGIGLASLKKKPLGYPNVRLAAAGMVFLVVILISGLKASAPVLTFRTMFLAGTWVLIAWAVAADSYGWTRYLVGLVSGSAIVCLYGLLQIWGVLPGSPPAAGFPPGVSTLGNQNYVAGLAAVMFWPSLTLWSGRFRFLGIFATLMFGATVFVGGAAGPQIGALGAGVFLGGIWLPWTRRSKRRPALFLGLFVITMLAGNLLILGATFQGTSDRSWDLPQRIISDNNGDVRYVDYRVAGSMFNYSPFLGVGAGNYQAQWTDYLTQLIGDYRPLRIARHTHNEYLQWTAETGLFGILGAVVVIALLGIAWLNRWGTLTTTEARRHHLWLTGGLAAVAIHSLVSFPLHLPATATAIVLFLGMTTGGSGEKQSMKGWIPISLGTLLVGFVLWVFAADMAISKGTIEFTNGNLPLAQEELARGVSRSPWPREGYTYLGLTEFALGRHDAAVESLELGLGQHPTYEAMLALVEIRIDRQEYPAAASMLAHLRSCRPMPSIRHQVSYFSGLLDLRQGHPGEAKRIWQRLVAADPTNFRALMGLGYLDALDRNIDGARKWYQTARRVTLQHLGQEAGPEEAGEMKRLRYNLEVAERALASLDQR